MLLLSGLTGIVVSDDSEDAIVLEAENKSVVGELGEAENKSVVGEVGEAENKSVVGERRTGIAFVLWWQIADCLGGIGSICMTLYMSNISESKWSISDSKSSYSLNLTACFSTAFSLWCATSHV